MMDLFGRKLYFFVMFVPMVVSWIIIALATTYEMLICGMAILGFGIGMGFCVSTYISEISSSAHRGALLGLITVFYNMGSVICNTLMYFTTWKTSAWIYALLCVCFMLSTFLLPESPAWLYSKGKKEIAIKTLCSIRCSNANDIKTEIEDMEKSNSNKCEKFSFAGFIKKISSAWKPFLIVAMLPLLLPHSGFSILVSYTIFFFDRLRLPIDSSKFAIGYAAAGVIGSVIAPYIMHRMKRRTLMAISSSTMGLCAVIIGIYEEIFYHRDDKLFPYIVSVSFYAYAVACNAGVLLIAYCIGSEVFPNEVRGIMNGLYGVFTYFYWSVTIKLYPTLMNIFDIKIIIWSFAAFCFLITTYSYLFLPETKGLTLNEVQEKYFQKKSAQKMEEQDA
ncbi:facilitated trehalose transporter Tret1-like [Planococcus citri]|uniref:facilitated trehalose transporter Tret1-like n=1 Tax=Planococcus citri TaxID=170843 RepID=UPI0031FA0DF0